MTEPQLFLSSLFASWLVFVLLRTLSYLLQPRRTTPASQPSAERPWVSSEGFLLPADPTRQGGRQDRECPVTHRVEPYCPIRSD